MTLDLALKVIGWALTATPLVVFLVISFYVIMGAAGDDDLIKALVLLGVVIFFIGAILLVLVYLTNLLSFV